MYEIHCNVDAMRFAIAIPCNVLVCVIFFGTAETVVVFCIPLCWYFELFSVQMPNAMVLVSWIKASRYASIATDSQC